MPEEPRKQEDLATELEELQKLVRDFINSMPIGIVLVKGSVSAIAGINPAFEALYGYEARELAGQDISTLFGNAPWARGAGGLKDWCRANYNRAVELEGRCKSGASIPVDVRVTFFGRESQDLLMLTVEDESERFAANKLKQDFYLMINHDIRSPLTSVIFFLEMMNSDQLLGTLTTMGRERLVVARRNIDRILALVHGLLELDKVESSIGNLDKQSLNMRELVESCIASVAETAAAKGIHFDQQTQEVSIQGDKLRLEQLLINLLSNGIGHSASGKPMHVTVCHTDRFVRVAIRDNGPGVPDSEKPIIFEKFKQGSTKKSGGFGLGLAICKEIVKQHQGKIGCDDAPGGGSIFWFELPALSE